MSRKWALLVAWLAFTAGVSAGSSPSVSINARAALDRRDESQGEHGEQVYYGTLVSSSGDGGHHHHHGQNASVLASRQNSPELGTSTYGPLVQVPGCLFCPPFNIAVLSGEALLKALDTQTMKRYMRVSDPDDLLNKCVFYTRAVEKPPQWLSVPASEWACRNRKYSIWHLWPNAAIKAQNPSYFDFYAYESPTDPLNSIDRLGDIKGYKAIYHYFEKMSEAMAQSCTGEVVVMSQHPENMAMFGLDPPNIWWKKERPALIAQFRAGLISRFLVVQVGSDDGIWELNIVTNERGRKVPPSELQSRGWLPPSASGNDTAAMLEARQNQCSSGLAQMGSRGDPFSEDTNWRS